MQRLHDQLDAQVQAWKDEAAKEAERDKATASLPLEASIDTTFEPESMWRSTPPTPEEIYLDDTSNGLFDTEAILDFTVLDA
ncbi:hypothetical protein SPRG_18603 [Saprolegnia parasitica CBS 223.65]|uniref:Uncharacterized protein n=1 Tax=Saprolegnia parasitica (strain CBS 223.65) TaxID=695850 RepID=A0A067BNB8_SAPPC|nr:hypothetical protein SPRG_18603 [Saprolegnia parasitica CBS 223.65]KDO15861.1 hypothetical protein SPRG_18603 [Saprolegnia parasitica CBS 223.65]|eukprot:XP_012213432.1 hypothetical protein SPRG_18603 [Saprolegnia parasitica CBS 223.65]